MDRLTLVDGNIKFIYQLPKSEYECLIETTCLHPPHLKPNLDLYLKQDIERICGTNPIYITRSESGKLPMSSKRYQQPMHSRHVVAGQAAGALRPSSGYGFKRILHWANHAAANFNHKKIISHPHHHLGFQHKMDQIFLNTLSKNPQHAPLLFTTLANTLSGDEFAKFMMDEANILIWYKIIKALPTKIMLQGITRHHEIIAN